MRRVIVIAIAAASLGGCASVGGYFSSTPPTVQIQLESQPPGANATTSLGPACKTPCSVSAPAPENNTFSVTYDLNRYQPATVQVNVVRTPGTLTTSATAVTDPNPVFAELQPAGPPPRAHRVHRKPKPRPAAAAPAPAEGSPFPSPNAPPPPPPPPNH